VSHKNQQEIMSKIFGNENNYKQMKGLVTQPGAAIANRQLQQ
jgi:hypothetical protein